MAVDVGGIGSSIVTQNYDAIRRFDNAHSGEKITSSKSESMRALTEDEVKEASAKRKSEPKTLSVESSEIINNVYSKTGDNITYDVNGVIFSNAEMKACKEVVKNAMSLLPTKGSDFDYENYASMGIAANMVRTYASANLSEEQAGVVNKSFETYLSSLIQAEKDRHVSESYKIDNRDGIGNTGELNKYYSLRKPIGMGDAESLKSQITSKIPQKTRDTLLENIKNATENGSVVQSASNEEVAGSIMNLFKNANLHDSKAVSELFQQYKDIITPVYRAFGLQDTSKNASLSRVIDEDIKFFDVQISNAKAIINNVGNTFNSTI